MKTSASREKIYEKSGEQPLIVRLYFAWLRFLIFTIDRTSDSQSLLVTCWHKLLRG